MKRFKVTTGDGKSLLLYYPTMEVAQEHYPEATITEHDDLSYVEYINKMLDRADDCKTVEPLRSTVYLLRFNTSVGVCLAMLFQDISDGIWYDLCEYQLWKSGAVVSPITKTLSDPAKFCKEFLVPRSEYTVLCYGGKLPKPKELKGVQKFASVSFEQVCQCQLFLRGDDLYIKHRCYFPFYERTGEINPCTHLERMVMVMPNAWLRITNFVSLVKHQNSAEIATTVWPMIREYHRWPSHEHNTEWERFLEDVANTTQKYLSENG